MTGSTAPVGIDLERVHRRFLDDVGVCARCRAGQIGAGADDLARSEGSVEHSIRTGLVAAGIA